MSNQHNPIAQRITHLQEFWEQQRALKPEAQFIRWLISEADLPLVNGFYKLESTPYGRIKETIVVMLTDFKDIDSFSYYLAKDWLQAFKKDTATYPELKWEALEPLTDKLEKIPKTNTAQANAFLVELLTQFKTFEGQSTPMFLGINPRKVSNHNALSLWICNLIKALPKNIGILVTDYKDHLYYEPVFKNENANFTAQSLKLKDQDMMGAYASLMTQGNPNDPQVAFRKCMLKMGEATKAAQKDTLIKWGEKGLNITKNTNDLAFWASAHLIYAGFLFGFKDGERIEQLLNKGINISQDAPENKNLQGVTLQLYAYKAAYYSFTGQTTLAQDWFIKQAQLAKTYQQPLVALTAYKNAFIALQQKKKHLEVEKHVPEAYTYCASLNHETLKYTEFPYIAKLYIDMLRKNSQTEQDEQEIQAVNQLLTTLFGNDWEIQGKALIKKIKNIEEDVVTPIN